MTRKQRGISIAEYKSLGAGKWHMEGVFTTAKEARSTLDNLLAIGFTHHTRVTKYVKA